jgi:hypothetical protein
MQNKYKGECHAEKDQQPITRPHTWVVPHSHRLNKLSFGDLLVFRQTLNLRRGMGELFTCS